MANQLYVIRSLVGSGRNVKIGITTRAKRRLEQLKVGTQTELLALATVAQHRHHEKRLHKELKQYRLPQSEWFDLDPAQQEELIAHVKSIDGLLEIQEPPPKRSTAIKSPVPAIVAKPKPRPKRTPSEREQARIEREKAKRKRQAEERKAQREADKRKREWIDLRDRCKALLTHEESDLYEGFACCWGHTDFDLDTEQWTTHRGCEGDEELFDLELGNPWIDTIFRPSWDECWICEEGQVHGYQVSISWFAPITDPDREPLNGWAHIYPDLDKGVEGDLDVDCSWMVSRYGKGEWTFDQLRERLWLLMDLPRSMWPKEVLANERRIEKERQRTLIEIAEREKFLRRKAMQAETEHRVAD